MDRNQSISLLRGLVEIPSLSHEEATASAWLVEQMKAAGYDRAFVDDAGNAVGEMGASNATHTVVLLGHIDTVPGAIPVRVEDTPAGPILYGRGSVDAKGPLATATAAVARVGAAWAAEQNVRLVVVGAVEEEAASSKGARFIRDRFDGVTEPIPNACIIGEPSGWQRVTLGYKGRVLVEIDASQPMSHTAGPNEGVATVAVDFWNWLVAVAQNHNSGVDKTFDQLSPSLRRLQTFTDEQIHDHVVAQAGIRLPLGFDVSAFAQSVAAWASARCNLDWDDGVYPAPTTEQPALFTLAGPLTSIAVKLGAYEPAWRSDRNNALVRSFLGAVRTVDDEAKPGFVVKSGTSDMNVVGPAWKCPILAYGPGDSALDHTPDEHVLLEEYWRAVQVLEGAIRGLV